MTLEVLDAATEAACAPDVIAPPRPGETRQLTPCESLVFAILAQAIRDYIYAGPAIRKDIERWFQRRDNRFGQYLWCCHILGLDAQFLWDNRDRWKMAPQPNGSSQTKVVLLRNAA